MKLRNDIATIRAADPMFEGEGEYVTHDDRGQPTILWTPEWHLALHDMIRSASEEVFLVTPWVKNEGATWVLNALLQNATPVRPVTRLLTSMKLEDFVGPVGASDLEAYMLLLAHGFEIRVIQGLHAKIYLCDSTNAIVTSGNLTARGLGRTRGCNLEVAVYLRSHDDVAGLLTRLTKIWERAARITAEDLSKWAKYIASYAAAPVPPNAPKLSQGSGEPNDLSPLSHGPSLSSGSLWWQDPVDARAFQMQPVDLRVADLRGALLSDAYLKDAFETLRLSKIGHQSKVNIRPPFRGNPLAAAAGLSDEVISPVVTGAQQQSAAFDTDDPVRQAVPTSDETLANSFISLPALNEAEIVMRRLWDEQARDSTHLALVAAIQFPVDQLIPIARLALMCGLVTPEQTSGPISLSATFSEWEQLGLLQLDHELRICITPMLTQWISKQLPTDALIRLRQSFAVNLCCSLGNAVILVEQIRQRGVDDVVCDLLMGLNLSDDSIPDCRSQLNVLIDLVRQESCNLRRLPLSVPSSCSQQLYARAIAQGFREFAADIHKLIEGFGVPWLSTCWRTSRTSPQLILTLESGRIPLVTVAISADGQLIIAASRRGIITTWDRRTGKVIRSFSAHRDQVTSLAMCSDGRRAISASLDGSLKVWDVSTGKQEFNLSGHKGPVLSVIVPDDQLRAISASRDGTLRVWDLSDGEELDELNAHGAGVLEVAIDRAGRRAVTASIDGSLRVWDLARVATVHILRANTKGISCIAVTPDGTRAMSGSIDRTVRIWDLTSGRLLFTLAGHEDEISAVALSPDGKFAISGSWDGAIRIWELEHGRVVHVLLEHRDEITSLSLTPDGSRFISTSQDGAIKIWETTSGMCITTLLGHEAGVVTAQFALEAGFIVSASSDGMAKVWDASIGRPIDLSRGHGRAVSCVVNSHDTSLVFSASFDGSIRSWNAETGVAVRTVKRSESAVLGMASGASGNTIAWVDDSGVVQVLDYSRGVTLKEFELNEGAASAVGFALEHGIVVIGFHGGGVGVWNCETGKRVRVLEAWPVSGRGNQTREKDRLASGRMPVKVWHEERGEFEHSILERNATVVAIAVAQDGRLAVCGASDGSLKAWQLDSAYECWILPSHSASVLAVAITLDGYYAVSGSADGVLRVWNLREWREIRSFDGHKTAVTAVAIGTDGQRVVFADEARTIQMWDIAHDECLAVLAVDSVIRSIAISPDGVTIVVGDDSGAVTRIRLIRPVQDSTVSC